MTEDLLATDIQWDISELLNGSSVDELMEKASEKASELEAFRSRIAELGISEFVDLINRLAEIRELVERAGNYVQLAFSVDTSNEKIGALMQSVDERGTVLQNKLVFLELEWTALDEEKASLILNAPEMAFCRHWLENIRKQKPHLLSEPEEVVLNEKTLTGFSAWTRLHTEVTSSLSVETVEGEISLENALSNLMNPDRKLRQQTAQQITDSLAENLRVRAFIYNTLLADKAVNDRIRKFDNWLTSRNLDNEASDESVAALVQAVTERYDIPQRWYGLKAKVLGLDRLADYDRMAPLGAPEGEFGWGKARGIVLDAYESFSPDAAKVVGLFFENPWIDAPVRPAKRGGAFCAYTVPAVHPYVLLNWTAKRNDVLTLAHELGHALHAYLAREQGIFHQTTPLTLAETASVFGEAVTFNRLLAQVDDPSERFALLSQQIEGSIGTVFRQIAMYKFEETVHNERRETGELSVERFGEVWTQSQIEMLGDSVEVTDNYRSWWSYIPHFIHTPGYVYAYAYGQLLALAVYNQYEQRGAEFVPQYLEMLRAGGSKSPQALGRIVDCDLDDPAFWSGGLDIVERILNQTQQAAAELV